MPSCSNCALSKGDLLLCGGCRGARYCSVKCQKAAWPAHKSRCKETSATRGLSRVTQLATRVVEADLVTIRELEAVPRHKRKAYLAVKFMSASKVEVLICILDMIFVDYDEGLALALEAANGLVSTSRDVMGGDELGREIAASSEKQAEYLAFLEGHTILSWALSRSLKECNSPESRERGLSVLKAVLGATPPEDLRKPLSNGSWLSRPTRALEYIIDTSLFCSKTPGDSRVEEVVRLLLARGEFQRGSKELSHALFSAVRSSPVAVVKRLLEAGADAKWCDDEGFSALHALAAMESMDTREKVRLLVAAGTPLDSRNAVDETPLLSSLMHLTGSHSAFLALLEAGADPGVLGAQLPDGAGLMFYPLHQLTMRGDASSIRSMLDPAIVPAGIVDVNALDAKGKTSLHHAAVHFQNGGDCAKVLIEAGADIHAIDGDGDTALTIASTLGAYRTVKVLLKTGALERGNDSAAQLISEIRMQATPARAAKISHFATSSSLGFNKVTPEEVLQGWAKIIALLQAQA